ncbi:MAG TPA: type II toxin-antitoxin system VapC family toxin [Nitrospirota bacterium]|nr:type II toxin-antitoxin system VapC family toxin [Nitrospirota bacterium]
MDNAYILDSYALIAHFEDEPGGIQVEKLLKAAQTGKTKLFLSVVNFGEVYYTTLRERGEEKAEEVKLILEQLPIISVAADKEITLEAAKLKGRYEVAYADCFAAALGIRKKAKVVTGDPEFKKFGDDVVIEWIG